MSSIAKPFLLLSVSQSLTTKINIIDMSKLNLFAINIDTPYNEIILADRARYKQLSPEDVQKYKDAFKASSVLLFFTIIIIITMQVAC